MMILKDRDSKETKIETVGDLVAFIRSEDISVNALLSISVGRHRADEGTLTVSIARDGIVREESNVLLCIEGD